MHEPTAARTSDRADVFPLQAKLSTEMTRLYKELLGREPGSVRTNFAGGDIVVCTVEEPLTAPERILAAVGDHGLLHDGHIALKRETGSQFLAVIERITGRKVRAHTSALDTENDVSSEVFYLAPLVR